MWMRANKIAHIINESCDNRRSAVGSARAHRLDHPVEAEFETFCVQCLGHSVSIKYETIARFHGDGEIICDPIKYTAGIDANDHSRRLNQLDRLRPAPI